jgi:hypothetical protein
MIGTITFQASGSATAMQADPEQNRTLVTQDTGDHDGKHHTHLSPFPWISLTTQLWPFQNRLSIFARSSFCVSAFLLCSVLTKLLIKPARLVHSHKTQTAQTTTHTQTIKVIE